MLNSLYCPDVTHAHTHTHTHTRGGSMDGFGVTQSKSDYLSQCIYWTASTNRKVSNSEYSPTQWSPTTCNWYSTFDYSGNNSQPLSCSTKSRWQHYLGVMISKCWQAFVNNWVTGFLPTRTATCKVRDAILSSLWSIKDRDRVSCLGTFSSLQMVQCFTCCLKPSTIAPVID